MITLFTFYDSLMLMHSSIMRHKNIWFILFSYLRIVTNGDTNDSTSCNAIEFETTTGPGTSITPIIISEMSSSMK